MTSISRSQLFTSLSVVLFFAVSTIVMTYPLSIHPATYVRDLGDPLLFAWMLSWMTNTIFSHPLELFQANAFFPFPDSLAFTDAPLGMLPIAAPVIWLTHNPVLAVNITGFAGFFLSGVGAFLLSWHLTRSVAGGIVAGVIYAFCPYRFDHLGHLQLLTAQWIPLALFFLHRGLENGRWRDFVGFGVCFLFQAFSSIYYALFLTTATGLFVVYFAICSPRRRVLGFLLKLSVITVFCGLAMLPYLQPYWRVQKTYGFNRHLEEVKKYSADVQDYLNVPAENIAGGVGYVGDGCEHSLFPGLGALLFAAIGFFLVTPSPDDIAGPDRATSKTPKSPKPKALFGFYISKSQGFYLTLAVCGFILSLGPSLRAFGNVTNIPLPFLILYKYFPGFDAIRSVSRFGVIAFLALAILAGDGVARIVDGAVLAAPGRWLRIALAGMITLLVMSEYASFPIKVEPIETGSRVPEVYRWLAKADPGGAVIEFPFVPEWLNNARFEYFSAYHQRRLVNGYSGFSPMPYLVMMTIFAQFPTGDSVGLLSALDVEFAIVHEDQFYPEVFRQLKNRIAQSPSLVPIQTFGKDHLYRVQKRTSDAHGSDSASEASLSKQTRQLISVIKALTKAPGSHPSPNP